MLFALAVVTALSATFTQQNNTAAGTAVVPMLYIFFGFYDIAFTPLSISYIVEILPFNLRAKGLSANLTVSALLVRQHRSKLTRPQAVFGANFFNQVSHVSYQKRQSLTSAVCQSHRIVGNFLEAILSIHWHTVSDDTHHM